MISQSTPALIKLKTLWNKYGLRQDRPMEQNRKVRNSPIYKKTWHITEWQRDMENHWEQGIYAINGSWTFGYSINNFLKFDPYLTPYMKIINSN